MQLEKSRNIPEMFKYKVDRPSSVRKKWSTYKGETSLWKPSPHGGDQPCV